MKKVIRLTESDLNRLVGRIIREQGDGSIMKSSNYDDILWLPDLQFFGDDLQTFEYIINQGKNKRFGFKGNLDLLYSKIESLGNLVIVGGYLDIRNTPIKSLGNLKHIGRYLNLSHTKIESLGNLEYVGGNLYLKGAPLSKTTTEDEIRSKVDIKGKIYFE